MKFIKGYQLFLEMDDTNISAPDVTDDTSLIDQNDKVNAESLQLIQKDISIYKSKKQVIENLFKDSKMDDVKLDNEIQKQVYNNERDVKKRNKYLLAYESLYKLKRMVDRLSSSINDDSLKKTEVQNQINELSSRFNQLSDVGQKTKISGQIEKSRDYLKQIDQTILSNKKELALSDKQYQTKRKNFETQMKIEEDKITKLS